MRFESSPSTFGLNESLLFKLYRFIIMLNWPSYQQSETWDYQRLDCVEGAKFLMDTPLFPAQSGGGVGGWWWWGIIVGG